MSDATNLDIERAIYHLFTGTGRKFAKVELGQFPSEIRPGLNVAATNGAFVLESMDQYRQDVAISLVISVKNVRSEYERRRAIHPLCGYAIRSLVNVALVLVGDDLAPVLVDGQPQPLDLDDLVPVTWRDATTQENFKAGETVFEVQFKTASRMPSGPVDDTELHDLDEILATFGLSEKSTPTIAGNGLADLRGA